MHSKKINGWKYIKTTWGTKEYLHSCTSEDVYRLCAAKKLNGIIVCRSCEEELSNELRILLELTV